LDLSSASCSVHLPITPRIPEPSVAPRDSWLRMSRSHAEGLDLQALKAELYHEWNVLRTNIDGVLQRQFEKQEVLLARWSEGLPASDVVPTGECFAGCSPGRAIVSTGHSSAFVDPIQKPVSDGDYDTFGEAHICSEPVRSMSSKRSAAKKVGRRPRCQECLPSCLRPHCTLCAGFDEEDSLEEPERLGTLAKIVDSPYFEGSTSLVIILNSIFMIYTTNYDIDHLNAEPTRLIFWAEFAFMLFYCVELAVKVQVHRFHFFCGGSNMWWNWFDVVVVIFGVFSQILTFATLANGSSANLTFMRTARILKLAKLSRTVRLMHQFDEMRLILNSLLGSLANLGWSIAMLALIFYLFALVFVQLTASWMASEIVDEVDGTKLEVLRLRLSPFGSVQNAMLTLYMSCTGGDDWVNFYNAIQEIGWVGSTLFVFFIAFMQIAVLNILTGIFVEQAMKLAPPDRDRMAFELTKAEIEEANELRKMCIEMDINGDGTIRKDELCEYIEEGNKLKAFLMTLGLNLKDADNFWDIIDRHHDAAIDIETFVAECMKLKGPATNFDLAYLMTQIGSLERKQRLLHMESMMALQKVNKNVVLTENGSPGTDAGYLPWSPKKPCVSCF